MLAVSQEPMVGKPNLPPDADQRQDLMGESMPTAGLTALDQEREASMADEGGMSGAVMESQDPKESYGDPTRHRPFPRLSDLAESSAVTVPSGARRLALMGSLLLLTAAGSFLRARRNR